MANFPGLILTADGRNLQAKAQIGQPLQFLRVALGDGNAPDNPESLSALVNERQSLSIHSFELLGDGTSKLRAIMTNQGLEVGFFVREIGVYARDPDTQQERLYSYSNSAEQSDFLPAEGGATLVEQIFDLVTVIGSAQNVTAVIDDYITIATKADIEEIRPYMLPKGGHAGDWLRKNSNAEGDADWADPAEGMHLRVHSVTETRQAVGEQDVFNLQKTITRGLAIYVNGKRLTHQQWSALNTTQVKLATPVTGGTTVEFVNNEEVGTVTLSRVSLDGPSLVYPGSSNSYTITDYDAFSDYTVATDVGTATRSGNTITLEIPAGVADASLFLTVGRNGGENTFAIAVGAQSIARPAVLNPTGGATAVSTQPTATTSTFQTYPRNMDTHQSTDWQIATDSSFNNIIKQSLGDTESLESWDVTDLPRDTTLYLRARHHGATLGASEWSTPVTFKTVNEYINTPQITAPVNGASDVPESPVIEASTFTTTPGGADTHLATNWQIKTAEGLLVWSSLNDAQNKTSVVIPAGVLQESTTYTVEVQYQGHDLAVSAWGRASFTTTNEFIPEGNASDVGTPFRGGYFYKRSGNDLWIVAPKAEGELLYGDFSEAEDFCESVIIGGYTDWRPPTLPELRDLYDVLAPLSAETPGNFQEGGSEAFETSRMYYSSTQTASTVEYKWFSNGAENTGAKTGSAHVRAIRKISVA
ncbi:phage tail protein [Halomonas sp. 15WGF]|uniref:phage tail-collar fiber domain-containing protein n=1 Tax=Halomonas sp. 15WGF TaxID=2570357 RepID=UPI0014858CC6|nr:phage tail protein [Halomonas sp. 15WGF]